MITTSPTDISDGRGGLVEPARMTHLAAGTMVSRDLEAARKLYEDFLGLEAVRVADDRMLLRDRRAKYLMEHDARDFFVIDVHQVEEVEKPQKMLNHWGISVPSQDEVRRIYEVCKSQRDEWYIKKVRPITSIHESYGFYFIDKDDNWWEIEHRGGMTNDLLFARGDYDNRTTDETKIVDPATPIADTPAVVVGPDAFMTHGTVDVANLLTARDFYEKVLGLRSVLRSEMAQFTAGGGDFSFVGVQVGNHVAEQTADNRWVLLVDDEESLNSRHRAAMAFKEELGIRRVTDPERDKDGHLAFIIENADSNWFEISTRPRAIYSAAFRQLEAA